MHRMQKDEFFRVLTEELILRGVSEEAAARNVRAIGQTLTKEDLADIEHITDTAEIAQLAQAIVSAKRRESMKESPPKAAAAEDEDDSGDKADIVQYEAFADDEEDDDFGRAPTARGKRIFWIVFLCTLPITLVLFLVFAAVFGAIFAVLCGLIVLLVGGLIVGVTAGALLSLIGLVYGVTQLLTVASHAPGLYEIGLGLIIAGCVMFGGILVYNLAVRLIPLLIRWLGALFRYCTGKIKDLFHMAKEACYKL